MSDELDGDVGVKIIDTLERCYQRAEKAERELAEARAIILDAYKGILVLWTMCDRIGLEGGREAADQLIGRMLTAMPDLPSRAALSETAPCSA